MSNFQYNLYIYIILNQLIWSLLPPQSICTLSLTTPTLLICEEFRSFFFGSTSERRVAKRNREECACDMDIIEASLRPGKLGGQNEVKGTAAPFTNANGELLEVTVIARSITRAHTCLLEGLRRIIYSGVVLSAGCPGCGTDAKSKIGLFYRSFCFEMFLL